MIISGRKGQTQSQSSTPKEAPNSLQSKNTARLIDLLCEGPIQGLVNGKHSIFFDDTPVLAPNGKSNFKGVTIDSRLGTSTQEPLKGFPFIENEVDVGTQIKKATPVIRAIDDPNVDAVRVKIRIPQLLKQDTTTGDVNTTKVIIDIQVQNSGGSYERIPLAYSFNSFTGSTTSTDCKGLRVTVKGSLTGLIGQKKSVTLTAQYRAVGSGTWLTLGTRKIIKQLTRTRSTMTIGNNSRTQAVDRIATSRLNRQVTIEVSTVFEVTGLSADDYEFRVTSGTLVQAEEYIPTYISIVGKNTTPYEVSYRVPLDEGGAPWNIKVIRITDDSDSTTLQNDTYWSTYTEVIDAKLIYPDSALVGLTVDAELFGTNVPVRAYEIDGLQIQVPSNYDPDTRIYTGIWDGTFQVAWTDNPAWVLYDLLIHRRYGLGQFIDASQVDKFALYDIAQYCDVLVDDGFGETEPRFTFNGIINTRKEAYDVLNMIASAFMGMLYWASGAITVTQDSPGDPVKLVTPSNVIDGKFDYSGSSLKSRHTVVLVTWNDPENGYKPTVEVVEDQDLVALYGWNQLDTVAIGCTSRGQAHRFGHWILDSEKNATETVTYKAGFDHVDVRPGNIIAVADPDYADVRFGGRVVSATTGQITIDQGVTISSGQTYDLSVTLPNGAIETQPVTNTPASGVTVLTVSPSFSDTPINGSVWVVTASNVAPRQFRVLSIRETEKHEFEITGLFYDPTKYNRVESGITVELPDYTLYPTGDLAVVDELNIREYKYQTGIDIKSALTLSWQSPDDSRVGFYEIEYQGPLDEDYRSYNTISGTSIDFLDTTRGFYNFRVRTLDSLGGLKSEWIEKTFDVVGLYDAPADVTNFNLSIVGTSAYLSWDKVADLDLLYYVIKFSPQTSGATWGSSSVLFPRVSSNATGIAIPTLIGTYLIKAVDTSAVESNNETLVITTIGTILGLNVVTTISESPDFSGVKSGVTAVSSTIRLNGADTVDDWADVDALQNFDIGENGIVSSGTYNFANTLDLGAVYTCRMTPTIAASGGDLYANMDFWTNIDNIENWDGGDPSKWEVILEVRSTNDDPAGAPTWSSWKELIIGDYQGRAFEWRLLMASYQAGVSPVVTDLSVLVDMEDRIITGNDLATSAGVKVVSFSPAYKADPAVSIGAQNMATGDYFVISAKSKTGFTISFYNSSNTPIDRTFDYVAKGYGVEG